MADVNLEVAVTSAGVPAAIANLENLKAKGLQSASAFQRLASASRVAMTGINTDVSRAGGGFVKFRDSTDIAKNGVQKLSEALRTLEQGYRDVATSAGLGATASERLMAAGGGSLTRGMNQARTVQAMREAFNADPVRDLITVERELAAVEDARLGSLTAQKTLATARWERELSTMTPVQQGLARITRATQELAVSTAMLNIANARVSGTGGATVTNYERQAAAALRLADAERGLIASRRELASAQESDARATITGSGTENAFMSSFSYFIIAGMAQQATQAIAGFGAATITAAAQIERAFADVHRTFDGTDTQLVSLQSRLRALATSTPISIIDLSQIAALGNQLGVAAQDIESFTTTIAQYSTISGMSAEDSATAFGRISNLTGLAASQFSNLGSAIEYTARTTVATESTIANTAKEITALASGAGFSADAIVGLSGALSSLAIPPERARGALSLYFGALNGAVAEGGPKLAAFAQLTGKTADEIGRLVRENKGQEVFTAFISGLSQLDTVAKTSALDTLGLSTIRVDQTMRALAQNVPLVTKSFEGANKAFNDNTELGRQYAIIQDTLTSKFTQFQNAVQIAAGALGAGLEPALMAVLGAVTDLIVGFTDFAETPIGAGVLGIAGAVTGVVLAFTALVGTLAIAKASLILIPWALTGLEAKNATKGIIQFTAGLFGYNLTVADSKVVTGRLNKELIATGVASTAASRGFTVMKFALAGTTLLLAAAVVGTLAAAIGNAGDSAKLTAGDVTSLGDAITADTATWRETGEAVATFSSKADGSAAKQKEAARESKNWANVLGTDLVAGADAAADAVDKIAAGKNVVEKFREAIGNKDTFQNIIKDSEFVSVWSGLGLNMTELIEGGIKGENIQKKLKAALLDAGAKQEFLPGKAGGSIWTDKDGKLITKGVNDLFTLGTTISSTGDQMQNTADSNTILNSGMEKTADTAVKLNNGFIGAREGLSDYQDNVQAGLKQFADFKDILKGVEDIQKEANKRKGDDATDTSLINARNFGKDLATANKSAVTFFQGIQKLAVSGHDSFASQLAALGPDAQLILADALKLSPEAQAKLETDARFAAFLASDAFKKALQGNMVNTDEAFATIFKTTGGDLGQVRSYIAAQVAGIGQEWEKQWNINHPDAPLNVTPALLNPSPGDLDVWKKQLSGELTVEATVVPILGNLGASPGTKNMNKFTDKLNGATITLPANLDGAALTASLDIWQANENASPKELAALLNKDGLSASLDDWRTKHGTIQIDATLRVDMHGLNAIPGQIQVGHYGHFAHGGEVNMPRFADGGAWGQFRGPGSGTSDSIMARVSAGEYINTASSTDFWGPDFFDSLNRKMLPTSFLNMLGAAAASNSGPSHVAHVNVNQINPLTRDPLKKLRADSEMLVSGIWGD